MTILDDTAETADTALDSSDLVDEAPGEESPAAASAGASPSPAPALPPVAGLHSLESERVVISILMNPVRESLHHKLMGLLAADDFFAEENQAIWTIMASMREVGVAPDPVAVIDHAQTRGEFIGGPQYVIEVVNDPIARMSTDEAVEAAASRIKGFAMSRRLQRLLQQGVALCTTGQTFEQVLSFVEDDVANLKRSAKSSNTGPQHSAVFYDAYMAKVEAKLDGKDTNDVVPTGYPQFDEQMGGGLPSGGMTVIAGRPGMGKTAFAVAIEQMISLAGRPTLTFSTEMSGLLLVQRSISRHSRIPFKHIKSAAIEENEFGRLTESIEELMKAPCYIDETPGLTLPELRSRARAFIQAHPNGVIFVDYLQLIVAPGAKDERNAATAVSKGLTDLAKQLKCPVVALAQLNRSLESRANKRPVMADLRESGQIEQDASIIIFLYRDEVYNPDTSEPGVTEAIFAKNRDGETRTIKFQTSLATMHYQEMGAYDSQE